MTDNNPEPDSSIFHQKSIMLQLPSQIVTQGEIPQKNIPLNEQVAYRPIIPFIPDQQPSQMSNPQQNIILKKEEEDQYDVTSPRRCKTRPASKHCFSLYKDIGQFLNDNMNYLNNCNESDAYMLMESYVPQKQNPQRCIKNLEQTIQVKVKQQNQQQNLILRKALKNIFYLYLNGDYRGISENVSILQNQCPELIGNEVSPNRFVSYKYKSKHVNFDCSKIDDSLLEDTEEVGRIEDEKGFTPGGAGGMGNDNNQKKQMIYNKSKYVMQLLLKFLDSEHLAQLDIYPEGLINRIQQIQTNIRESSKKKRLSQSEFFNHLHFSCLFMILTPENIEQVIANQQLMSMHAFVFGVEPEEILHNPYTMFSMNLLKLLLSSIIMTQLSILNAYVIPQLPIHTLSFKSTSKLRYFQRICQSIPKLNKGKVISKF